MSTENLKANISSLQPALIAPRESPKTIKFTQLDYTEIMKLLIIAAAFAGAPSFARIFHHSLTTGRPISLQRPQAPPKDDVIPPMAQEPTSTAPPVFIPADSTQKGKDSASDMPQSTEHVVEKPKADVLETPLAMQEPGPPVASSYSPPEPSADAIARDEKRAHESLLRAGFYWDGKRYHLHKPEPSDDGNEAKGEGEKVDSVKPETQPLVKPAPAEERIVTLVKEDPGPLIPSIPESERKYKVITRQGKRCKIAL